MNPYAFAGKYVLITPVCCFITLLLDLVCAVSGRPPHILSRPNPSTNRKVSCPCGPAFRRACCPANAALRATTILLLQTCACSPVFQDADGLLALPFSRRQPQLPAQPSRAPYRRLSKNSQGTRLYHDACYENRSGISPARNVRHRIVHHILF